MISLRYFHDNTIIDGQEREKIVRAIQGTYRIKIAIQPQLPKPYEPWKHVTEIIVTREATMNGELETAIEELETALKLR